jgi:hypothetical protein
MEELLEQFAKLSEMDKYAFLEKVAENLDKNDQYHIIDQVFGLTSDPFKIYGDGGE